MIIPIEMRKHRDIKSSILRDIKKRKKCETTAINRVVCSYGDLVKFETPINDNIVEFAHGIENSEFLISWKNLTFFEIYLKSLREDI